mmetsp:Transcript_10061/g.13682  ORF Transcript_10061/g.13682 Transcript_10061/m.13682 type:complete len:100 (+) Transcript_10061:169-468(+)
MLIPCVLFDKCDYFFLSLNEHGLLAARPECLYEYFRLWGHRLYPAVKHIQDMNRFGHPLRVLTVATQNYDFLLVELGDDSVRARKCDLILALVLDELPA